MCFFPPRNVSPHPLSVVKNINLFWIFVNFIDCSPFLLHNFIFSKSFFDYYELTTVMMWRWKHTSNHCVGPREPDVWRCGYSTMQCFWEWTVHRYKEDERMHQSLCLNLQDMTSTILCMCMCVCLTYWRGKNNKESQRWQS